MDHMVDVCLADRVSGGFEEHALAGGTRVASVEPGCKTLLAVHVTAGVDAYGCVVCDRCSGVDVDVERVFADVAVLVHVCDRRRNCLQPELHEDGSVRKKSHVVCLGNPKIW